MLKKKGHSGFNTQSGDKSVNPVKEERSIIAYHRHTKQLIFTDISGQTHELIHP